MWPYLFNFVRVYAPYITLPVAAVIGAVGYTVENMCSDKYTPGAESIEIKRRQRQEEKGENFGSTKPVVDKSFIPKTIFEKNVSPSLKDNN